MHDFNGVYTGGNLDHFAFPLGGLGAGMVALTGFGGLAQVSLRHRPDLHHEPFVAAGLHVAGLGGRLVQGPTPHAHALARPQAGNGLRQSTMGLPHFARAAATARFPFLDLALTHPGWPVAAAVTGWSPFLPNQADDSSLPVAALVYAFRNTGRRPLKAVFSFHAENFMAVGDDDGTRGVRPLRGGFVVEQRARPDRPEDAGAFAAFTTAAGAASDCAWFRGGWFDPYTFAWEAIETGAVRRRGPHRAGGPGGGGSLYVPLALPAGGEARVPVLLAWHVPHSTLRTRRHEDDDACAPGCLCHAQAPRDGDPPRHYRPWYATRFRDVDAVAAHWRRHYDRLRDGSAAFRDAFFDTTLPPEVVEAAAANLSILKSPTCLRQHDGRFWAWEGCHDAEGCCDGTCTHVWNYAQAMPHLFAALERTLRETEFGPSQDGAGHQAFRAPLPIRPARHDFHAALDGLLGGVMKVYREWRISGDGAWMARLWPAVRQALRYAMDTWDPDRAGVVREPHHNTYDIEFWGPNGFAQTFYLGALAAAARMADALDEPADEYDALFERARAALHGELYNGEWFVQRVQWKGLRAPAPDGKRAAWNVDYSPEALALLRKEGPKYQYGAGLLADGLFGECLARLCGLPPAVDAAKARRHLRALHARNFRRDLSEHANPQRPSYAFGDDGGLLMCTWPRGGRPRLPMVYAHEVWTGVEYQAAAHMAMMGETDAARAVVAETRRRYDGRRRNPFDEYECGHWYARAMASYGLLQAFGGVRYDAVERTLYIRPPAPPAKPPAKAAKAAKGGAKKGRAAAGDCRVFLCTATGYGTAGLKNGRPFLDVRAGAIPVEHVVTER